MHGDIQAVFDEEPPQTLIDDIEEQDELDDDNILGFGIMRNRSESPGLLDRARRRRWSSVAVNED